MKCAVLTCTRQTGHTLRFGVYCFVCEPVCDSQSVWYSNCFCLFDREISTNSLKMQFDDCVSVSRSQYSYDNSSNGNDNAEITAKVMATVTIKATIRAKIDTDAENRT